MANKIIREMKLQTFLLPLEFKAALDDIISNGPKLRLGVVAAPGMLSIYRLMYYLLGI